MVRAVGLDLVEIARIERDLQEYGERFLHRILSEKERELYERRQDKAAFFAGRFAAKEAVIKALGAYLQERPPYHDIQILPDAAGIPTLTLPPEIERHTGGAKCFLSITHEKNYAAAVAVFSEEP